MAEDRNLYPPSQQIIDAAHVTDYDALREEAAADPVAFWEARAKELLDWYNGFIQLFHPVPLPCLQGN